MNYLVIHGGIPGDMKEFPSSTEEVRSMSSKKRRLFDKTLRTRFISKSNGKMIPLGEEGEGDPFWAEVYDGRFGRVLFGHEPFKAVMSFPNATGLDTGCVFGGELSFIRIPIEGTTNHTVVIGDVHGMIEPLVSLVKAHVGPADKVVFVGDLVDKGPVQGSISVVKFVREMTNHNDVVVVEGNHEEKHRRFRKHLKAGTGNETKMKGYDELLQITEGLSKEDHDFMDTFVPFHRF